MDKRTIKAAVASAIKKGMPVFVPVSAEHPCDYVLKMYDDAIGLLRRGDAPGVCSALMQAMTMLSNRQPALNTSMFDTKEHIWLEICKFKTHFGNYVVYNSVYDYVPKDFSVQDILEFRIEWIKEMQRRCKRKLAAIHRVRIKQDVLHAIHLGLPMLVPPKLGISRENCDVTAFYKRTKHVLGTGNTRHVCFALTTAYVEVTVNAVISRIVSTALARFKQRWGGAGVFSHRLGSVDTLEPALVSFLDTLRRRYSYKDQGAFKQEWVDQMLLAYKRQVIYNDRGPLEEERQVNTTAISAPANHTPLPFWRI